jgi:predicted RNA methylase
MVRILPFNPRIWKKKFPPKEGLEYSKLKMTDIGEYSITKNVFAEAICDIIVERRGTEVTVSDATAGMGGITIPLAMRFPRVNAVELDPLHSCILRNNLDAYGMGSRVNIIEADFVREFEKITQDVVVIDPPWQGRGYKAHDRIDLFLSETDVLDLIPRLSCSLVILFVPFNFNLSRLVLSGICHRVHRIRGEKHYLVEITPGSPSPL